MSSFLSLALTAFLTLFLTPFIHVSAEAAKHGGKHRRHLQERQGGAALGIGAVSNPVAASITLTTSLIAMIAPSLSNSSPVTSYAFSITVVQIPVATVCADTPASLALFSLVSTPSFTANSSHASATDHLPIPAPVNPTPFPIAVNATAFLPNGSSTTFLSYNTPIPTRTSTQAPIVTSSSSTQGSGGAENTARIVLDASGCQTLYSASTTALCNTTLSLGGQLPITVSDCQQYATFSSSAVCGGGGQQTAYFAAPWWEVARGGLMGLVKVVTCSDAGVSGTSGCATGSESWSVSTLTSLSVGTSVIAFKGPAILTHSSQIITTTLTINTTTTTSTSTILIPTIVRVAVTSSVGRTITKIMTMPTVLRTVAVQSIAPVAFESAESMEMQTVQVRTRMTVTVTGFLTSTMPGVGVQVAMPTTAAAEAGGSTGNLHALDEGSDGSVAIARGGG